MKFSEKLDLLMNITNTTNSLLARNISLDPSFVSRLRRGVRPPAKDANYIKAIAEYLSRRCNADYQKAALADAMKSSFALPLPDLAISAALILRWLTDDRNTVEDFLAGFVDFRFKKGKARKAVNPRDLVGNLSIGNSATQVWHGVEGKQKAVLSFLSLVLESRRAETLLLYSNEDLVWLTENPDFTAKWAALLEQVIRAGNRIKIIHTVNRRFDEMLSAIKEWVPLYMTGSIEPYYYSKTRDSLLRRTLFIAPETAVVASTTIGSGTKNAANFLHTDKNTINALVEEFNEFLSLCRPLMNIFSSFNKGNYLSLLTEFEDEEANRVQKNDGLSNLTMPPDVVQSLLSRSNNPEQQRMLEYQLERVKKFENSLQNYSFREIAVLPEIELIRSGSVPANLYEMAGERTIFYTPHEFGRHLQNIIRLLNTYDSFDLHFPVHKYLEGCMVDVKEDVGVIVGRNSLPAVIFAINESNLTAAFWDYMTTNLKISSHRKRAKDYVINRLARVVEILGLNHHTP